MSIRVQSVDPSLHAAVIARLLNFVESEPITEEVVKDELRKFPTDAVRYWALAEDANGQAVGMANGCRFAYEPRGRFSMEIVVAPPCREQGIGAALYDHLLAEARGLGATSFSARVRDDCPQCLAFAEKRGFAVESHRFESVLDLASYDAASLAGTTEAVQRGGIRFFSLADTDGSEPMLRRLYDLNTITGQDIPGNADAPVRPFEQFARSVFGSYWYRPDGQIVAAEGDRWVGMASVGEIAPGAMYNLHTGVLRAYRGRHIALALKLLALDWSQRQGANSIRTNNDSRNAGILAINRKLGYQAEPGWYQLILPALP